MTGTGRIGVKCWINKGEIMPEGYGSAVEEDLGGRGRRRGANRQGGGNPGGRQGGGAPAAGSRSDS